MIGKVCSNKECNFAGQKLDLHNFPARKDTKNKLRSTCTVCTSAYGKKYKRLHKENIKNKNKKYNEDHKQQRKEYDKKYGQDNKEHLKARATLYRQNHKQEINQYFKQRRKKDINFRLEGNLRNRLNKAIKNNFNLGSAVRDMCCSIEEMFKMFESMYENNPLHPILGKMCRDNYGYVNGVLGWEIDHIIPLSSFDLTNRQQFLKAVHYTNLRPMWASQNRSENDRGLSRNKK